MQKIEALIFHCEAHLLRDRELYLNRTVEKHFILFRKRYSSTLIYWIIITQSVLQRPADSLLYPVSDFGK